MLQLRLGVSEEAPAAVWDSLDRQARADAVAVLARLLKKMLANEEDKTDDRHRNPVA